MRKHPAVFVLALLLCAASNPAAADGTIPLDGDVPDDAAQFFWIPFQVPPGTTEIEVLHDDLSADNILDWGLYDPAGYRGWGGGNTENAIVNEKAASRSYLPGAITPGMWRVLVGKAKIAVKPAHYHVVVTLRNAPTLAAQTERAPYRPAMPLKSGLRWYAGDFHVHSRESGDAKPTLDAIATFARGRGLDFVALSDHNTTAHLQFINDAQSRRPDLLLIPSVEFTTYAGHANALGATQFVDHKIGFEGATIAAADQAFAMQKAVFSINHPVLDLGPVCIGCSWKHEIPAHIGAIEIATGGWMQSGRLFDERAIAYWDELNKWEHHLTPLGGSDDHSAGTAMGKTDSPIGDPTTMVLADSLSAEAIIEAVRRGRTVVKLQGPGDPMVDLTSGNARIGDTVNELRPTLTVTVTGGKGTVVRLVRNGQGLEFVPVDADPFTYKREVTISDNDRYRAEVWDGSIRTVTGHLYIPAFVVDPVQDKGKGCNAAPGRRMEGPAAIAVAGLFGLLGIWVRRRRRE